MTTKDKVGFVITGLAAAFLLFSIFYYVNVFVVPNQRTEKIVRNECRKLLTNEKVVVDLDFWGEELVYDRWTVEGENESRLIVVVASKGQDKELDTADDIIVVMRDTIPPSPPKTAAQLVDEAGKDGDKWARRITDAMKREGIID